MSLRPPPRTDRPSRAVARILFLTVLALAAGVVIWAAVTDQRIELTETTRPEDLELEGSAVVNGMEINVDHVGLGRLPVILLHDVDMAGSALWDGVIDEFGRDVTAVKIDLPGFGLSSRITEPGPSHTVAAMAEVVGAIIEQRFRRPVIVAGVGLGGEVAAELAVTRPELLQGLVMVDVDFWARDGWMETAETLPFFGRPVTYALETGGQFSFENWAPKCEGGGWCPSKSQSDARRAAVSIQGTTDSLHSFRETPEASLVPSRLQDISIPAVYVWSSDGDVPADVPNRVAGEIPGLEVVEVAAWKAHLDAPGAVAEVILSLDS